MDDMILLSGNKRELHKARVAIKKFLTDYGLELKGNWQVFKVDDRSIDFMGFRFWHYKTTVRKRTSLRIKRRFKKANKNLNFHNASACFSYMGWVKYADMHDYYTKYIKPYFDIKKSERGNTQ